MFSFRLSAGTVSAKHRPSATRPPGLGEHVMRIVDVVFAAGILAVLALPMLVVPALIRLSSPGPALFRQRRVGAGREPFTFYKFRTMYVSCSDTSHRTMIERELRGEDTSQGGSWKLDRDPRVTPFGKWLRRTSIDELPQLINVLRGEMSLVGPRPCLEWEAEMFPAQFAERFAVRPGMTGLWQVSGRSTMGTLDMLKFDVAYVRNRSLLGDLGILARTLPSMLEGDGAR
jgi:lipopolysaccharide/colanic/teichoic acid biosynthesis glycosyltransferase